MAKKDIIVIGASAGGIQALIELAKALPSGFPASLFVVQHTAPFTRSYLPEILSRSGLLPAVHPKDGETFRKGKIYIAPPDHHLLLDGEVMLVRKGPKENRFRPAVDALFRSAAYAYGNRVIGLVLTGLLSDGTSGMYAIHQYGGMTIVQDPEDAQFPDMPASVLQYVKVDHVLPLEEIPSKLVELTKLQAPAIPAAAARQQVLLRTEVEVAAGADAFERKMLDMGRMSPLTCPECHGAMVQLKEGKLIRFRCHTGHAFSADALLAGVSQTIEEDLWSAIRGLEESVIILEEIGKNFESLGEREAARNFYERANGIRENTLRIRAQIPVNESLSEGGVQRKPVKNTRAAVAKKGKGAAKLRAARKKH